MYKTRVQKDVLVLYDELYKFSSTKRRNMKIEPNFQSVFFHKGNFICTICIEIFNNCIKVKVWLGYQKGPSPFVSSEPFHLRYVVT